MKTLDANELSAWLRDHDVEEAVTVEKGGVAHAVMIPYALFQAMHRGNRTALRAAELGDEDLEAIRNSAPPADSARYDDELDD